MEGRHLREPQTDPAQDECARRVVEPEPAGADTAAGADVALERDLVPGEIKLKLAIDPSRPGSIDVRIEPDAEKVQEGRLRRSARLEVLTEDTPKDKDGSQPDPLEFRRAMLDKLRADGSKNQDAMTKLERRDRRPGEDQRRSAGPRTCSPGRRGWS